MSTEQPALSKLANCHTCRHILTFHPGGGPCEARGCSSLGTGKRCMKFQAPPDARPVPPRPTKQAIGDALDVIITSLEYAAGTPDAPAAADHLKATIMSVSILRLAWHAHPARLPARLSACQQAVAGQQDAEVATEHAHEVPRERPV